MPEVDEHNGEIDGLPVFWRSAPHGGTATPRSALPARPCPTSSRRLDRPVPRRTRRASRPDLPGLRSLRQARRPGATRSPEHLGLLDRWLDELGIQQVPPPSCTTGAPSGWLCAQRLPERVPRLAIVNAVPLPAGLPLARLRAHLAHRGPLAELAMGLTSRCHAALLAREANVDAGPMSGGVHEQRDRPLRSGHAAGDPAAVSQLATRCAGAAGAELGACAMPALVVWGTRDPYIPARFAAPTRGPSATPTARARRRRSLAVAGPPRARSSGVVDFLSAG